MHGYNARPSQKPWSWSDQEFKEFYGDIQFKPLVKTETSRHYMVVATLQVNGKTRSFTDWWGKSHNPGDFYAEREATASTVRWAVEYERLHPGVRFRDGILVESIHKAAQEYDAGAHLLLDCPTWWQRRHPGWVVPQIGFEAKFRDAKPEVQAELISEDLGVSVSRRAWYQAMKGRKADTIAKGKQWVLEECPRIRQQWNDKQIAISG